MPWFFAAVLLAVLVAAQQPFEGSAESAWWRVAPVAGGMAIAPLTAAVLAARAAIQLRRNDAQRRAIGRWLARWRRAQTVLWAAVALASVVGCQWGPLLRDEAVWRGATLPLVWLPLLLAPVVVPLVLSWAALDHVDRVRQWLSDRATTERAIGTAQPAPLTDQTLTDRPPDDRAHGAHREPAHTCPPRAQTSRTGLGRALDDARLQLGPTLLPVVVLLAVDDLLNWALPAWHQGAAGWLPPAVTLLALIAAFPWLLEHTWRTTPLAAGHLRTRLEAEARRAGVRIREILVWQTDGRVANAAVVGFIPRTRRVLLSDGLLSHLDESQVLAVFRHELGHLRHHHHALRLALLALPLCAWLAVFPPGAEWIGAVDSSQAAGNAATGHELESDASPAASSLAIDRIAPEGPPAPIGETPYAAAASTALPAATSLGDWFSRDAHLSLDGWFSRDERRAMLRDSSGEPLWAALLLGALMGLFVWGVFRYVAPLLEHEADLFACTGSAHSPPSTTTAATAVTGPPQPPAHAALVSSLEKLAWLGGQARHARGWQHASVVQRAELVARLEADPALRQAFSRRMRRLARLVFGLVVASLAVAAWRA